MDRADEKTFVITIGKTTYEVTTHFNPFGRETVLEQLKSLLLELNTV